MTIAEQLERQMKQSDEFTRQNFGLQLGSDYPEIVREVMKSETVCVHIAKDFVLGCLTAADVLENFGRRAGSMRSDIAGEPRVYSPYMSFLYWGIQIGRELERESVEALRKMEAK